MSSTRALLVSQVPPPVHGSTLMTLQLLAALRELGIDTLVTERRFSQDVRSIGQFRPRKLFSAAYMPFRLFRDIVIFRPDVVVFFVTNREFSFLVDCMLSVILRVCRVPVVNYVHTVGFKRLGRRRGLWGALVKLLLGGASRTVVLGTSLVQDVAPWVRRDSIDVIPNSVALPPEAVHVPVDRAPYLLYLSNLIPEKGAEDFVATAARLSPRYPDLRFVLVGAESSAEFAESLRKSIAAYGVDRQVTLEGAVSDTVQKWRWLRESQVLVFPSRYPFEAQPLTIVEAMAVGVPVVAYDTGGIRDLVVTGENGSLIRPDADRLAEEVDRLLSDPILLDQLRTGARNRYVDNHSSAAYTERWGAVLSKIHDGAS